jgi:hypothetical protein
MAVLRSATLMKGAAAGAVSGDRGEELLNLLSHEGKVRVKCRCERGFALTDRDALDLNPASTICISIAATKALWSAANGRARARSV